MQEINYKIRKIRELINVSQEYVAGQLGLSQNTYSNIENGTSKLSYERFHEIAKVLKVDPRIIEKFDTSKYLSTVIDNHQTGGETGIIIKEAGLEEMNLIFEKQLLTIKEMYEKQIAILQEEVSFYRKVNLKEGK